GLRVDGVHRGELLHGEQVRCERFDLRSEVPGPRIVRIPREGLEVPGADRPAGSVLGPDVERPARTARREQTHATETGQGSPSGRASNNRTRCSGDSFAPTRSMSTVIA